MSALPLEDLARAGRRQLTPNQVAVVDRLVEAAAGEAREHGYEGMTVRSAARRAGVAAATAYTHFSSKDQLLAEVLWRRMADLLSSPVAAGRSATDRVIAELRHLGTFMVDDPEVAAAGTTALLSPGDDVRATRVRLGTAMHDRLAAALGPEATPELLRSLDLVYTGALLWMGMGHLTAEQVPQALEDAGRLLMQKKRPR
jgi:AcrR family transcriptional regulator